MIKAYGQRGDKPMFLFGLSRGNCEQLLAGKPIVIDLDVMTMDQPETQYRGTVMIIGGETEESMQKDLQAGGVDLPPPRIDPDMP